MRLWGGASLASLVLPKAHLSSIPSWWYSIVERLKCMVSSLPHFSHAVSSKDKDGLCSEGLIDQNNCASICLLKAEQTTASQRLYFHQLSHPLMLLTWVVLMCYWAVLQARNTLPSHAKTSLHKREHIYWSINAKWMCTICWQMRGRNKI